MKNIDAQKILLVLIFSFIAAAEAIALEQYSRITLSHLTMEYDVEWEEGLILTQAHFTGVSKASYTPPEFSYIPTLYPPLYMYILNVTALKTEKPYFFGRMISLFFLLSALIAFACIIFAATENYYLSILAGLSAFTFYAHTGYWYNLIRVDMAAIFLSFVAAYIPLTRLKDAYKISLISAFLVLAIFTKQAAVFVIVPVLFYRFIKGEIKLLAIQILAAALLLGISILIFDFFSEGYFSTYTWEIGLSHGYMFSTFTKSLKIFYHFMDSILPHMTALLILSFVLFFAMLFIHISRLLRTSDENPRPVLYFFHPVEYLFIFGFSLVAWTFYLTLHPGAYLNNNIPGFFGFTALSIASGKSAELFLNNSGFVAVREIGKKGFFGLMPPLALLWVLCGNLQSESKLTFIKSPFISGIKRDEIEKFKKILTSTPGTVATMISIGPISNWKVNTSYHEQSLVDLRNHSRLKNEFHISLKNTDCGKIIIAIDFDPQIINCGEDFILYHLRDMGLKTELLSPATGFHYIPEKIFIRKNHQEIFLRNAAAIIGNK